MSNQITGAVTRHLEGSREHMTVDRLCELCATSAKEVKAALRELAQQGQIEVIPANHGHAARYGWLRSAKPVASPAPAPERQLTPEAEAERAQFISDYGHGGNCSCHLLAPCGSCTHPGNPRNQDEDESAWASGDGTGEALPPAANVEREAPAALGEHDLSDDEIDAVFEAMPNGVAGWLVSWGYRDFARELLARRGASAVPPVGDPHPIVDADLPFTGWQPPAGYLLQVPGRKPRILRNRAHAEKLALSAAAGKPGRGTVFELIPVGSAKRGAEWTYL